MVVVVEEWGSWTVPLVATQPPTSAAHLACCCPHHPNHPVIRHPLSCHTQSHHHPQPPPPHAINNANTNGTIRVMALDSMLGSSPSCVFDCQRVEIRDRAPMAAPTVLASQSPVQPLLFVLEHQRRPPQFQSRVPLPTSHSTATLATTWPALSHGECTPARPSPFGLRTRPAGTLKPKQDNKWNMRQTCDGVCLAFKPRHMRCHVD